MVPITASSGPALPGMMPADTSTVSGGHGSARLSPQVWSVPGCSWWGVCRAQQDDCGESSLRICFSLLS